MRQILEAQARGLILKLYEYFEQESQNGGPLVPVTQVGQRVAAAVGISRRTVSMIIKEKYGTSGMEDKELKTPNKTRRKRPAAKTVSGDDSDDDQPLVSINQDESAALRICKVRGDDTESENYKSLPVVNKKTKTDYKRHSFFTMTHSGAMIHKDTLTNALETDNSALEENGIESDNPNSSDRISSAGVRVKVDALNTLTNTKSWNDEPVLLVNEIRSVDSNTPIDPLSNIDAKIDLDALNALENSELSLVTQDTVMRDKIIPTPHDDKIKTNISVLDENELNCFKIFKSQSQPVEDMDKPSNSRSKLPVAQKTQVPADICNKSIAKANFKIGRLKDSGIVNENETDDSEANHPESNAAMSDTIDLLAIRNHVKEYHVHNQYPTIRTLLTSLNEAGLFSGNKVTLLKIMADIGFKFNRKTKL